jgi:hypothetical protein
MPAYRARSSMRNDTRECFLSHTMATAIRCGGLAACAMRCDTALISSSSSRNKISRSIIGASTGISTGRNSKRTRRKAASSRLGGVGAR